jgi:hypothetical protein
MKFKLLKIKKRTPEVKVDDCVPQGINKTVGKKLPFNEMGAKQLPSSKLYSDIA